MKKIVLSFLILFLGLGHIKAQEHKEENDAIETIEENIELNWIHSYKEAERKSAKENKPILIYFTGSDWCSPCIKLKKELFYTEEFKSFSEENLILYRADFPRNKDLISATIRKDNERLSKKFSQRQFPTMLLVNSDGTLLGSKKGVYMTEYYFPFFKEILQKYYGK